MTTLIEILPLILGEPTTTEESLILYMVSGAVTVICFMFFLKLFLLIGGYMSPNRR